MAKVVSLFLMLCLSCSLSEAMAAGKVSTQAPITVFGAASLKESLDEVSRQWEKKSGQKVLVSYAASSALAKQIEQGAPADIFISADGEWMDYLQSRKKIDVGTRFNLVGNQLVLIVPAASKQASISLKKPDAFLKALGEGRLAVAETGSVPAGRYAKQSLIKMKAWNRVSGRLAQAENVRAAMAFVARGESPLGIVYATDAKAEPKVRVVAVFAEDSHDAITYPVARMATANAEFTGGFMRFLRSREAMAIFRRAGFTLPR